MVHFVTDKSLEIMEASVVFGTGTKLFAETSSMK